MVKQSVRSEATKGKILASAQALFAEKGYSSCSTEDLLAACEISRGALYHHFPSKKDVFEAVFVAVSDGAIQRAQKKLPASGTNTETLVQVCLAWLAEVRKPEVAAILIDQGPQVLGWLRARDLEAETSLGLMTLALTRAVEAGEIAPPNLPLAARILNAALAEMAVADRQGPAIPQAQQEMVLRQLLKGMAA